jgi:hypothetical protein
VPTFLTDVKTPDRCGRCKVESAAETENEGMADLYTPRQGQYLAFIHAYTRLHGQPPAEADMAAYFGVTPPSVHQMVVTLEQRGLIERTPGQARSLRIMLPATAMPDLESGRTQLHDGPSAETKYPDISQWIVAGGLIELGRTDYSRSLARMLDEGGILWEGKENYTDLDELLRDVNEGIARWMEKNG